MKRFNALAARLPATALLCSLVLGGCALLPAQRSAGVPPPKPHTYGLEVGAYPNASALTGSERILGDQSGVTSNITPAQVLTYIEGQLSQTVIAAYWTGTGCSTGTNALLVNGNCAAPGGGGGTPGGSTNSVQYNNASAFGGISLTAGTILAGSGSAPTATATPTLGASGTLGSLTLGNATSGTVTLNAVTGALGTVTASLPANTGTIAELNFAQAWSANQTFNNSTIIIKGSSTGTDTLTSANAGASNFTTTIPANTGTVAELNLAQSWTVAQTFANSTILLLGSSTGATTFTSANAGASNFTITFPATTGTLAELGLAQTWSATQTFGTNISIGNINLGTPTALVCTNCTGVPAAAVGDPTQVTQNAAWTFLLTDDGKSYKHTDGTARTYTIPANASVAFNPEACIQVINDDGAAALTLAITTDTLEWPPMGTTGSRTITAPGFAVVCKVDSTKWYVKGGANIT